MFRVLKFFFLVLGPTKKIFFRREMQIVAIIQHTHTTHLHHVCCHSTNRVRRRRQGHQGSGATTQRAPLFCFLTSSSSSFFGFVASARDLDGSASRAMMSGDFCVSIIQTEIPKRVVPRGKAIAETIWISKEEEREEKRVSETLDVPSIKRGARSISSIENAMMERYVFETRIKKKRSLDTNKKNPILFYTTNIFLPKKERDTDQNKLLLLFFHQQTVQVRLQGCQG